MTAYFFRRTFWLVPIMMVVMVTASALLQVSPGSLAVGEGPAGSGEAPAWEILFNPPDGGSFWQSRFCNSIRLIALALALAAALGLPLGVLAAFVPRAWLGSAIRALSGAAISLPGFLLAGLAAAGAALWRQRAGAALEPQDLAGWALPAAALAFGAAGYTAQMLQTALVQVMGEEHMLSVRAKGLPDHAIFTRHLLKNALISLSSVLGPAFSSLVVGSFLVEAVSGFPGMGQAFAGAILQGDRSLTLAGVLVYAFLAALAGLAADLLAAFLDPRLRSGER